MDSDDSDALAFLDRLIKAHEDNILEILENALWVLSNYAEGKETMSTEELLERLRDAIQRNKGQELDREINYNLGLEE